MEQSRRGKSTTRVRSSWVGAIPCGPSPVSEGVKDSLRYVFVHRPQALRGGQSSSPRTEHVRGDRIPEGQPGGVQGAPVHPHGLSQVGRAAPLAARQRVLRAVYDWGPGSLLAHASSVRILSGDGGASEKQFPSLGTQLLALAGSWYVMSVVVCSCSRHVERWASGQGRRLPAPRSAGCGGPKCQGWLEVSQAFGALWGGHFILAVMGTINTFKADPSFR